MIFGDEVRFSGQIYFTARAAEVGKKSPSRGFKSLIPTNDLSCAVTLPYISKKGSK
jgi:hypothetical protein